MLFMYSLWDPRPSLGHVPLALVHEDHGVEMDGQNKNYGEQTAQGLLDAGYLNSTRLFPEDGLRGFLPAGAPHH